MFRHLIFFLISNLILVSIYSQESESQIKTDHDIYNYIIDDCIGYKKCKPLCISKRNRRLKRGKRLKESTIILNSPIDSSYEDYYYMDLTHCCSPDLTENELKIVNGLILELKEKKKLARIDSSQIKNNRRYWVILYGYENLTTVSSLYISKIEKGEKGEFAVVYANFLLGSMVGKGFMYVFKKVNSEWMFYHKNTPWVS